MEELNIVLKEKRINKKGILLISTLFFVIVLIMMSVALFALTRANYADMRSFYSENEAINNAESAINIASFIIASNPSLFTVNSNKVNSNLFNQNQSLLTKNKMKANLTKYNIIAVNLNSSNSSNNTLSIISNSNNNFNSNFNVINGGSNDMVALIISPVNKGLTDSGAIIFFGNSFDSSNTYKKDSSNTYKKDSANAVAVSFNPNKINFYFSENGSFPNNGTYPLYTSVNNLNNNIDINSINGYRVANKFTLLLMAMGYSKVPNTNRYVVRYIDQKLANGGVLGASAYVNDTMDINATGDVFSIADQTKYNKLIANRFGNLYEFKLGNPTQNTTQKVEFKLSNGQDSNINGYLIAKQNDNNKLNFDGRTYNSINELLSNGRKNTVSSAIKADISVKNKSADTSKIRDSLANLVKSKFNDPSTYITLPTGYYIFVDSKKVLYFPPNMNITQVQSYLDANFDSLNLSDGINQAPRNINITFPNITVDEYKIQTNDKNIKIVPNGGNFFFVSSYGKVNRSDNKKYFGNRNVQIVLGGNQGSIMYGEDIAVTIDGVVKGKGTFAILNSSSSPTSITNSFAVDYINPNLNAFSPYRNEDGSWVAYNSEMINPLQNLQSGSMVVRFDQVKSSSDKLTLLVDNNLYINPIDFNTQNLDWFDHIFAYTLTQWAPKIEITKGGNRLKNNDNEYKTAFQYLFDNKRWDFDKLWKYKGDFDIDGKYKANTNTNNTKLLSAEILTSTYQREQYRSANPSNQTGHPRTANSSNWTGNPGNDMDHHKLTITININNTTYNINNTTYEIQLVATKENDNSTNLTLMVYNRNSSIYSRNSYIYSSTLNIGKNERDSVLGLLDSLDGTTRGDNLTLGKLAWVMQAFIKNDPGIIKDVTENIDKFDNKKLKEKSKDFAESRLEGLYQSYLNALNNKRWTNNLPITSNPKPNSNYFPFLSIHNKLIGETIKAGAINNGAINNLADRGTSSILVSNGFSEKDVKLQGMVFVGNQLKAKTGDNNNLLFQGNLIVGNTRITDRGNLTITGVKNTTFFFDLNSIDINLLNGAMINLVPVLYKQESVISK